MMRSPHEPIELLIGIITGERAAPAVAASAARRIDSQRLIQRALLAAAALLQRFQHLVEAEAADFLARRELLERGEEPADVLLRRDQ